MGNSGTKQGSPEMSASLKSIISSSDIVVFQSPSCPYCRQARTALDGTGKQYTLIDADGEQRSQLANLTGSSSVPSVWIKGKFVGGCNDGPEPWMGIKKIINAGKLDEYLA